MAQILIRRTTTANHAPTTLAVGELALGLGDDPVKMWVGTASGIKQLFAGEAVEDAEDDAVYGRCNGDWVKQPDVLDTPPSNPPPNTLWFDAAEGLLYLWYDDGDSQQWVGLGGEAGSQGPQGLQGPTGPQGPTGATGPQGLIDEPPTDGAYLRKNGVWIPMTTMSNALTAQVNITAGNVWFDGPTVNVGTTGTWFVSGTATLSSGGVASMAARLWDGTTVIDDGGVTIAAANYAGPIKLAGVITDPAGPLRLSAAGVAATARFTYNEWLATYGLPITSRITAVRIG